MVSVVDIIQRFFFMVSVVGCLWFPSWQGTFFMVSVVGFLMISGCYRTAAASPMETVKKPPGRFRDELNIHKYIYIYIHRCVFVCLAPRGSPDASCGRPAYPRPYPRQFCQTDCRANGYSIYIYIYICICIYLYTLLLL